MSANARKALILSPSASHPQDYGNRNRVFQTTSRLKNAGFDIHFLLYPYEADWVNGVPESAADMRSAWNSFTVIPPSMTLHAPPQGSHHQIDEWWDPQIGTWLQWLFAREAFDVFVVNYTFFSKAFEFAPRNVIKILETHDIFSGRKELFVAHGAQPEFFYTTPEQEKLALDRADIVVAIKDAEADHLRSLTDREVVSVPFDVVKRPVTRRAARLDTTEPLHVGFIGALNTVNALNMTRFLKRFAKFEKIYVPPPIEILIAGNVCTQLSPASASVKLLGHVPSVAGYYENIDVVVAPMSFSTGIKIKVGEALSYGKPVVATQNGFDGFPSTDEFHTLDDIDAVCGALMKLAFDRERLKALEEHSAFAAQLASRRSAAGYDALSRAIGRLSKAVVFVTDEPVWKGETIAQERLAQWAEYCSHLTRVVIVYTGEDAVAAFARGNRQLARNSIIVAAPGGAEAATDAIRDLTRTYTLVDIVISAGNGSGSAIWNELRKSFDAITLDTWVPELARIAGADAPPGDIWVCRKSETTAKWESRSLSTTALRYLPDSLRAWSGTAASTDILTVLCDPDESDLRGVAVMEAIGASGSAKTVHKQVDYVSMDGSDLLVALQDTRRARVVLAVGRSVKAVEACRSMAALSDAVFLHLATDLFPICFVAGSGQIELCHSFADIAAFLPDLAASGRAGDSEHPRDTGWSTYWRQLAQA